MSGRALIIVIAGFIVISVTTFRNITQSTTESSRYSVAFYNQQMALNISQSGINLCIRKLVKNPGWRTGYNNASLFGGIFSSTLDTMTLDGNSVIRVVSSGTYGNDASTSKTVISKAYYKVPVSAASYIPGSVLAAITTNNNVATNGSIIIDGRDHLKDGTLVAGQGTYAFWTTGTYSRGGNSKLGSTNSATDYDPAKVENNNVRLEGQSYAGGYPDTPEDILGGIAKGFTPGLFKTLAQSGIGGSQYTTNPASLTSPFKGITYVELPSGGTWQSMNITGSGILIVHNSSKNAIMKNLNSGTFSGIMIVDDLIHVHSNIIGAVICLSPAPSEGNVIGNGNGAVLYSRQAINTATGTVGAFLNSGSSASNVIAWWE